MNSPWELVLKTVRALDPELAKLADMIDALPGQQENRRRLIKIVEEKWPKWSELCGAAVEWKLTELEKELVEQKAIES